MIKYSHTSQLRPMRKSGHFTKSVFIGTLTTKVLKVHVCKLKCSVFTLTYATECVEVRRQLVGIGPFHFFQDLNSSHQGWQQAP